MPTKIALFPLLSKAFATGMAGITFTLSSKTSNGGNHSQLGCGGAQPINAILTGPVSVTSSGTSNGCF